MTIKLIAMMLDQRRIGARVLAMYLTVLGIGTTVCAQGGACCLPNGTCVLTTGVSCDEQGGEYSGDGTTCTNLECRGACCLSTGTCTFTKPPDCAQAGGVFLGVGVVCEPTLCAIPGACCLPDGGCVQANQVGGADCVVQGGAYQGDDTSCPAECVGACCFTDASCVLLASAACATGGGQFLGAGANCVECIGVMGGCCFSDGSCIELSLSECFFAGGEYQGPSSPCDACPQPGGCCFENGACILLIDADCTKFGGEHQGAGSTCAACPQSGGCCFSDGACVLMTVEECAELGGDHLGAGSTCAACPQPGGCCFSDGACVLLTVDACGNLGGEHLGPGSTCSTCPQIGGCCFSDGSCVALSLADCSLAGGTSQGLGTTCDACPEGGGCCFPDGSCVQLTTDGCSAAGGTHQGPGTTCGGCPQPGACCQPDGSCLQAAEVNGPDCTLQGGAYQGNDSECGQATCPQPLGACCLDDGGCVQVTEDDCQVIGGGWQGLDSSCDAIFCPPIGASCCESGSPRSLLMQYTGDDCSALSHSQDPDHVECETFTAMPETVRVLATNNADPSSAGARVWFDGIVSAGEFYEISALNAAQGDLDGTTWIHVFDLDGNAVQVIRLHTSCSDPLITGDQYASALLLGCEGEEEPIDDSCCELGDPRALIMQYTGEDCSATDHAQSPDHVVCEDLAPLADTVRILATNKTDPSDPGAKVWFDGIVSVGELYEINALNAAEGKLEQSTWIHVLDLEGTLLQTIKFRTNCDDFLFAGNRFGSAELIGCVGEDEPIEGSCCQFGDPRALTMQYTGADCSATDHSQNPSNVVCQDLAPLADTVRILATNRSDPANPSAKVWFDGVVSVGGLYEINALNAAQGKLEGNTWIHVLDLDGMPLQTIKFRTNCEEFLFAGNRFGSALLVDCVGEDEPIEGSCCDFGPPRSLTMQHLGADCAATQHFQDPDDVSCQDFAPMTFPIVRILATDESDPADAGAKVWFDGVVAVGDSYVLSALNAGATTLAGSTWIHVFDLDGTLLQTVGFHTSCSEFLTTGNQFGSALLIDCVGEDEPFDTCPPDITGDGLIDVNDLLLVILGWGECLVGEDCIADVTGDGVVDVNDLLEVILAWGACE